MTIRNSTRVHHEPGEIVWGRIFNGIEDNKSAGKWRPVVILESGDREHRVVDIPWIFSEKHCVGNRQ